MTTVYSAKDRVDIGIGASKVIDVNVTSEARTWAFIDLPRHPDKHSVDFEYLGNGKMKVTNNSRYVVSLWPNQPFLGVKEYKKATLVTGSVHLGHPLEDLDLDVRIRNILRENGIYTAEAVGRTSREHLLTFKGVGVTTVEKIFDAWRKWDEREGAN